MLSRSPAPPAEGRLYETRRATWGYTVCLRGHKGEENMTRLLGKLSETALARAKNLEPTAEEALEIFTRQCLALGSDCRILWIANATDTTTSTTQDGYARTITWNETLYDWDTQPLPKGKGWYYTFNGTDNEGDIADAATLTFFDGSADQEMTIAALIDFTGGDATSSAIIGKYDDTGDDEEWIFQVNSSDDLSFRTQDASEGTAALVGRSDATNVPDGWHLVVGTYNAGGANASFELYLDGITAVSDTDAGEGSYTAMEDQAETVSIGHTHSSGSDADFFDGKMAFVVVYANNIGPSGVKLLTAYVNDFYDTAYA